LIVTLAAPALAQDTSRGEVTAGWRYHHVTLSDIPLTSGVVTPNDYPEGWYADMAANLSPKFALVGEAGGTYHRDELTTTSGSLTTASALDIAFHTFLGGIRIRAPQRRAIVPFGQILFGGIRQSAESERSIQVGQGTPSVSVREESSTSPVLALDAGVTLMAGPIAIRSSGGYARFFNTADADAFRFSLGAGFRF
jgi:hypothetical protein